MTESSLHPKKNWLENFPYIQKANHAQISCRQRCLLCLRWAYCKIWMKERDTRIQNKVYDIEGSNKTTKSRHQWMVYSCTFSFLLFLIWMGWRRGKGRAAFCLCVLCTYVKERDTESSLFQTTNLVYEEIFVFISVIIQIYDMYTNDMNISPVKRFKISEFFFLHFATFAHFSCDIELFE